MVSPLTNGLSRICTEGRTGLFYIKGISKNAITKPLTAAKHGNSSSHCKVLIAVPGTLNPKLQTLNAKPQTLNPKSYL